MKIFSRQFFVLLVTLALFGCADRYQEAYDKGYQAGYVDGLNDEDKKCQARIEDERDFCSNRLNSLMSTPSVTSTEVCGGGGVNVNGRHYPGGKTGCVRVFSNGKVERY